MEEIGIQTVVAHGAVAMAILAMKEEEATLPVEIRKEKDAQKIRQSRLKPKLATILGKDLSSFLLLSAIPQS